MADIVRRDNDYYSADEAGSGDINDMLDSIPFDSYGREARAFVSEIGLDDLGYELPGEDAEVEYEVVMLVGAQPDDVPAGAEKQTAHLRVLIRSNESVSADNADDAVSEVEFIARELRNLEESMEDYIQAVRSQLVDGEYIAKGAYDRTRGDLVDKTFEHWDVTEGSGGSLEFAWRSDGSQNVINDGGEIPQVIKMYGQDYDRNITELYSRIFGSPMSRTSPPRTENPDLNRNMARNLENLYSAEQANPNQQKMKFGPEYAAKAARIILAKDSHFIIQGSNSAVGQNSKYPTQPIGWMYKINMNYKTSEEEIQVTQDILDFFNKNPEMVNQAAQKTIQEALSGTLALAQARKDDISSGRQPFAQIRQIENMYTPVQDTADGMKAMMIARWINQNFEQMDEVEKYVAYYKYLRPIVGQQVRRTGPIQTDGDDAGKPDYFDQEVQTQLTRMGAPAITKKARNQGSLRGTVGEPRPAQESMEAQIGRIDDLLNELLEVRRYRMRIELSLETTEASSIEDYKDVIRACKGITTVNTESSRKVRDKTLAILSIKFALKGQESRKIYLEQQFLPYIRGIQGLEVGPAGFTFPEEITKLRETALGGYLTARGHGEMSTPKMSLQSVAQDWADGGVMAYDVPMDANNMGYHVMVPVEELKPYCSRVFRKPGDGFDAGYQNFIKNGPTTAVYVAVGQNGRIKITGNEDDVWYAMKSGLEELPVFFSYQKQV